MGDVPLKMPGVIADRPVPRAYQPVSLKELKIQDRARLSSLLIGRVNPRYTGKCNERQYSLKQQHELGDELLSSQTLTLC